MTHHMRWMIPAVCAATLAPTYRCAVAQSSPAPDQVQGPAAPARRSSPHCIALKADSNCDLVHAGTTAKHRPPNYKQSCSQLASCVGLTTLPLGDILPRAIGRALPRRSRFSESRRSHPMARASSRKPATRLVVCGRKLSSPQVLARDCSQSSRKTVFRHGDQVRLVPVARISPGPGPPSNGG